MKTMVLTFGSLITVRNCLNKQCFHVLKRKKGNSSDRFVLFKTIFLYFVYNKYLFIEYESPNIFLCVLLNDSVFYY